MRILEQNVPRVFFAHISVILVHDILTEIRAICTVGFLVSYMGTVRYPMMGGISGAVRLSDNFLM